MVLFSQCVMDYAIYMIDPQGTIVSWNTGAERIKGYIQEEVLGKPFSMFFLPKDVAAGLPEEAMAAAARNGHFETQDWRLRKGGKKFWALVSLTAIRDAGGKLQGFAEITRDITRQKKLEDGFKSSTIELEQRVTERTRELREKEVLLREVYHRVKNNLQVVQSLLDMGAQTIGCGADGRQVIETAVQRIHVMATAHEHLYQTAELTRLMLSEYLRDIIQVAVAANPANHIQVQMDFDEIPLLLDRAIPLGLLVHELISNCMKHAFSEGRPGTISISARIVPGAVRFVLQDNGKGLPENFDVRNCRSMGLKLACSLAQQLGGGLEFSSKDGCRIQTDLSQLFPLHETHQPATPPLCARC